MIVLMLNQKNTIGDGFFLILVDTLISEQLDYLCGFVLRSFGTEREGRRVEQALAKSVDDPDHNLIN